jgi:precorrin-4/cobalt-precorrin-4 C11-methyltransferase
MIQKNTVYFVGSGPGDPELITIKAKKLLEIADIIIYSGSLLNPEILDSAKRDASL